jgi:hypothetical protein
MLNLNPQILLRGGLLLLLLALLLALPLVFKAHSAASTAQTPANPMSILADEIKPGGG